MSRGRCGGEFPGGPLGGDRIYPAAFMMNQEFTRCPLVEIGGTPGAAPEPGPVGARWLARLFNVARLATMGVQPADLSAAGVEALVTLDAERAKVEREHIERARKG